MSIRRLNHVVLRVSSLEASTRFYRDVLQLRLVAILPATPHFNEMRFFRSSAPSNNHHDVAIIANATARPAAQGEPSPPGLFHLAFEVGTLDELEDMQRRLQEADAFISNTDQGMHLSVYGRDPDGISVEILWRVPNGAWSYEDEMLRRPLDYERVRRRWGGLLATGAAAGDPA